MNRISRIAVVGLLALGIWGCATIDIDCPDDGSTTTVAIGGNTVGLMLLSAGLAAAKGAGFGRNAPGATGTPTTTASSSHVHYTPLMIFGSDGASCAGHVSAAPAPTPTIIMQPPPPAPAYIVK